MNHGGPQSHHTKHGKIHQFQFPSTSSSAKTPVVDGSFIWPFDHRKNTLIIGTLAQQTPYETPTNSGIYHTDLLQSELELRNQQINIKDDQIEAKDQQIEKLQQALDQQQQLHAVCQNTVEAQRLQIEEAKRPQPLLARLKAVFAPE